KIGQRHIIIAAIAVGEGKAGAKRYLRADDAVTAVEILLLGEHVHGAALALGVTSTAAGELGHDAARFHACGQHVAVVTIAGNDLITFLEVHLHTHDDSFLSDVKMAEAANEAHAIE